MAEFRLDLGRPRILTEQQEGQDPLQHRRGLQPPRQRNVERRKLDLHGPAEARTAPSASAGNLAAPRRLRGVRPPGSALGTWLRPRSGCGLD